MKNENGIKKVLHVIDSFGVGGAEIWLLATVKWLKSHPELNTRFDFLATGGIPATYDAEVKSLGCEIHYLKYSIRSILSFRRGFRKILKENNYLAIHHHQDFVSGWHYLLGLGCLPKARISHVHNSYNFVSYYLRSPLRWISYKVGRWLMAMFTGKITGTSNQVMNEYGYNRWPYKNKRVAPAYCGFDTRAFGFRPEAKSDLCAELNINPQSSIALFVGRLGLENTLLPLNEKNPVFALSTAKELVVKNKGWIFLFAGYKGIDGNEMELQVANEGLGKDIRFLGVRNDISKLMAASNVLLLPSLREGLGMVVVEAQAAGLPCVISDNVPEEAILFRELIVIKKLCEGVEAWSNSLANVVIPKNSDRVAYERKVESTPFYIGNSVDYLISLYFN